MCRNESEGHGDETDSPCFLQIFASNIFHLINETTYLHTHPTESPLFGSCQLLATQAPRLCSIPAEPLSVQPMNKKISRTLVQETNVEDDISAIYQSL